MAKLHTIVLHKDEDVTSAIHAYLMDKKWKAGVIVSAVGSIYDVTVGNPGSYEMPPKMLSPVRSYPSWARSPASATPPPVCPAR